MAQKTDGKNDRNHKLISAFCRIESKDMNIIDGIISIIIEYYKHATWSNQLKGDNIELSEDDSKAICTEYPKGSGHSVCANFTINRGDLISWELECRFRGRAYNFLGVVSSQITDFNLCPGKGMKHAHGIDDEHNKIYDGTSTSYVHCDWLKPQLPLNSILTLRIIADWTEKQCKLTFFYKEQKLNTANEDCTMLLPELDDAYVWYPCVTPYNKNAYCIIRYV